MNRIVIAGSRNFNDYEHLSKVIDDHLKKHNVDDVIFITGGCRGADMLGERYAKEHGFVCQRYSAQWSRYGKAAGPMRNREMAKDCDTVICFWDQKSKGTRSMIEYAKQYGKLLHVEHI